MIRPKFTTNIYAPSSYTITIVGAGIAGITAAYHLTARGFNVVLLEARSRIGGRIDTISLDSDVPVELGCQFIHGPGGNPLIPLLKRYHIEMQPISHEKTIIYDAEGKPIDIESPDIQEVVRKKMDALSRKRVSQATEYSIKNKSGIQNIVERVRESTVYMPYRKDSLLAYKFGFSEDYTGGNYIVTNGLRHLVEGMFQEALDSKTMELKLNQIVNEIKHSGRKVIVKTTNNETFESDALVCAVPLGVLKQNVIKFEPEFPKAKKISLENLGMAILDKTILEFETVFWPNDVHYLNPYDYKADIWREIINLNYFTGGKTATLMMSNHVSDPDILKKSDHEIINDSLDLLKKIFGSKLSPLKSSVVTHWYKDPYAFGSFSYHKLQGSLYDNAMLAESYGRLCFAGEHTSSFPSSIHGAYLSGIQAAEDIRSLLYHLV